MAGRLVVVQGVNMVCKGFCADSAGLCQPGQRTLQGLVIARCVYLGAVAGREQSRLCDAINGCAQVAYRRLKQVCGHGKAPAHIQGRRFMIDAKGPDGHAVIIKSGSLPES